jgi:NAD(P)-dependent dehydrogenase (short-subunit alcohol dehydrogenase family)
MAHKQKTVIVTGASRGIGAAVVTLFLERGYDVVATARNIVGANPFGRSERLALVDGDISQRATARKIADTAVSTFGSIDALVNNAGMFMTRPFTEFTIDDFRALSAINLESFIHLTQLAIEQMLAQKSGGSVTTVTTSRADHPIAGINASIAMITKGGLNAASRSLAMEYAKERIRVNTVAPGIVDTGMHRDDPKEFLRSLSPMGTIADVGDIAEAVLYLTEANQVTGEVLHVDGGAHLGRW